MEITELSLSPHFPKGLQHGSQGPTSFHQCPYLGWEIWGDWVFNFRLQLCSYTFRYATSEEEENTQNCHGAFQSCVLDYMLLTLISVYAFWCPKRKMGNSTLHYAIKHDMWRRVILPHVMDYPSKSLLSSKISFKCKPPFIVWIILSVKFPAGNSWHTRGRITQGVFI